MGGQDMIMYLQADRYANDGSAYMGAWFFRESVTPVNGGSFEGEHKNGDLLMLANFTNGGADVNITLYQWDYGTEGYLLPLGSNLMGQYGFAIANPTPDGQVAYSNYQAKDKKFAAGTYPEFSMFEGGFNLSKFYRDELGVLNLPCFSTVMIETRSSAEINAVLKDFAISELETCGIDVSKRCTDMVINGTGDGFNSTYEINLTNTGFGDIDRVELNDTIGSMSDVWYEDNVTGHTTYMYTPTYYDVSSK